MNSSNDGQGALWRRWLSDPLKGRTSLGRAFWWYGVSISVAYSILGLLLDPTSLRAIVVYTVIGLAVGVLQSVILWRCAPNSRSSLLRRFVRTGVVVGLILVPLVLYVIVSDPGALLPR
jgi:hypothetical protein